MRTTIETYRDDFNRQTVTTVTVTDEDLANLELTDLQRAVLADEIREPADILQNLQIIFLALHQKDKAP